MATPKSSSEWYIPFALAAVSIFLAELFIVFFMSGLPQISSFKGMLVDAIMSTVVILPLLFFFFFKPMMSHFKELEKAEEKINKSEERYRSLVESTEDSIYLIDRQYQYLFMNRHHASRLGFAGEDYIGRSYRELHSPEEISEFAQKVDKVLETGESVQHEHKSRRDGRYFLRTLSPVRGRDGAVSAVTVISKQITERKKIEEQLLILSLTDELTGLYNRRGFMNMAEQQIKLAERMKTGIHILSADLDSLKSINDTFGHKAGDEALKEAADIFRETFRNVDIIARIGGDEFAVLMLELSHHQTEGIKGRLQDVLDIHNTRKGRDFRISLSMGMAYYPFGEKFSVDDLLVQADKLMYEQKRSRRKPDPDHTNIY